jgi:hypothetical protein
MPSDGQDRQRHRPRGERIRENQSAENPESDRLLVGVIGLSTGTRSAAPLGDNQVGTRLIRIRAVVALDVQSDLNSQASGVGSTSQPISEPRLSR